MELMEKARTLRGEALWQFARTLYEGDGKALCTVIAGLTESGSPADCETIAAIISVAPISGSNDGDYYAARYGNTFDMRYLDLYLGICRKAGLAERDYIKVLLAAGSADEAGELIRWDAAVDVYLTKRAHEDFSLVESYIDMYDKKYTKYYILVRIDPERALTDLVNKLIYGKNIDKTAIRDALMDHSELTDPLMSLYLRSQARERAAVLRLLLLFKNDAAVRDFIDDVVAKDASATVQHVLTGSDKRKKIKNAPAFFDRAIAEGHGYTRREWKEILSDKQCAAIADRLFFCLKGESGTEVLVYNDGAFLNMHDEPQTIKGKTLIYVLHPLDVPSDSEVLFMRISQPVEQITRKVYSPVRGERFYSDALKGTMITRAEFDRNIRSLGFAVCGKRTAGEPDTVALFIGDYCVGVECELPSTSDTACCGRIYYYAAATAVKLNRTVYLSSAQPMPVDTLPRREFSELTRAVHRLFCRE